MNDDDGSAHVAGDAAAGENLEAFGAMYGAAHIAGDGDIGRADGGIDVGFFGDEDVLPRGERTFDPAVDVERAGRSRLPLQVVVWARTLVLRSAAGTAGGDGAGSFRLGRAISSRGERARSRPKPAASRSGNSPRYTLSPRGAGSYSCRAKWSGSPPS